MAIKVSGTDVVSDSRQLVNITGIDATTKATFESGLTFPPGYTNGDLDAHLNTSTALTNYVLSWDGTDYAWTNTPSFSSIAVSGTVDGRDLSADGAKLDGIESGATADQTPLEILSALSTVDGSGSGLDADTLDGKQLSVIESEYQAYTNSAVSSLVDTAPGTLDTLNELAAALGDDPNFATTVTNSIATKLSLSGGTMTGDIVFAGTQLFDGRDVSVDGAKLDTIQENADVTDAASVQAAGALMDSELTNEAAVKALNQGVATTDSPTFVSGTFTDTVTVDTVGIPSNLSVGLDDATVTRSDYDLAPGAGIYFSQLDFELNGSTGGATYRFFAGGQERLQITSGSPSVSALDGLSVTGNIFVTGTVDGRDVSVDGTKLDGIEAGAEVNPTASELLTSIKTVDGTGSGLDADLLDGQQGSYYLDYNNFSNTPSIPSAANNATITLSAGSGLTGGGNFTTDQSANETITLSHADTSAQGSVNNSGATVIQDVTLDAYGHVTGLGSVTLNASTVNAFSVTGGTVYGDITIANPATYIAGFTLSGGFGGDFLDFKDGYGTVRFRMEDDGDFHADGNVIAYSTTISDPRLKTDIQRIDNALDKLTKLSGYTFTYTADGKESAGVLSTEVSEVLPSAIAKTTLPLKTGDDETVYDTVQYDQLHGLLIEAIKELKEQVEDLKAKIGE